MSINVPDETFAFRTITTMLGIVQRPNVTPPDDHTVIGDCKDLKTLLPLLFWLLYETKSLWSGSSIGLKDFRSLLSPELTKPSTVVSNIRYDRPDVTRDNSYPNINPTHPPSGLVDDLSVNGLTHYIEEPWSKPRSKPALDTHLDVLAKILCIKGGVDDALTMMMRYVTAVIRRSLGGSVEDQSVFCRHWKKCRWHK
ncbi:hypothetical protein CPB84DRAFT_798014 [Gymnopilus junonius]|uniref:Uncharacterized protein n=1 Tax=Gymnopilus junonius TaxID=109634 RepID=A0A9P5TNE2_GYMJU|nr:hypothetical protein CPB84DRAFT_798014 [Gymnopilus junonius]